MLWRNYARDFRYQFVSVKHPRGSQCFVCRENTLTGLQGLPTGGHLVAAPYVAGNQTARPSGSIGTPLVNDPFDHKIGLDMRTTTNTHNTRRLEVHANRGQHAVRDDPSGLLPDRIRHRADFDQPAVRALLSREAAV